MTNLLVIHFVIAFAYAWFQMYTVSLMFTDYNPIPKNEQALFTTKLFGVIIGTSLTWEIQLICWIIGYFLSGKAEENE